MPVDRYRRDSKRAFKTSDANIKPAKTNGIFKTFDEAKSDSFKITPASVKFSFAPLTETRSK